MATIYYGPVINPESLTCYKTLPDCLLSVGPSGNIDWIVDDVPEHLLQDTLAQRGCIDVDVIALQTGEFVIPGFIDTHTVSHVFSVGLTILTTIQRTPDSSMPHSSLTLEGESNFCFPGDG